MRSLLLAVVLVASSARAAPEVSAGRGRVVVDFAAAESGAPWFASALEQRLLQELSRFSRVVLVDKDGVSPCAGRAPRCLVDAYSDRAEVVVLGTLLGDRLRYEVHETWTGSLVAAGTMDVSRSVSGGRLQHQMGSIVRPIVQSGGVMDQLSARDPELAPELDGGSLAPDAGVDERADAGTVEASAAVEPEAPPAPGAAAGHLGFVVAAIGLALLPFLARLRFTGARGLWGRGSAVMLAAVAVGGGVGLVLAVPALREAAAGLRPYADHPAAGLVFNLVGGTLWAAFVLLNLGYALPPLGGIGRVRPDALWAVLRSWLGATLLRATALLAYLPVAVAVLAASRWFHVSGRTLWTLVMPGAGLLTLLWFLSVVDVLALYLDRRRVVGEASARNPWHHSLRRYLRGYLRRTGAEVGTELLGRILFLPSQAEGVGAYGGGLAAPRILVNVKLLELALGLPEDPESPERKVNLDELPFGVVLPVAKAASIADGRRRAEGQERARRRFASTEPRPRGHAARRLGVASTLLGWITPSTRDETVPLISNTQEDYEVVHSLLTEHYAAFEKDVYDDDDDTDPRQKDFLFGPLLRELGALRRRDTLLTTLRLAYVELCSGVRPLERLNGVFSELYARFFSRAPAAVADAYAALNSGRDHLIQYYALLRSQEEGALTARADGPALYRASRDILDALEDSVPEGKDRQIFRATVRNRLISLSRFFYSPIPERHARSLRVTAAAVLVATLTGLVALSVTRSFDYHSTYLERMRGMQERLDETSPGGADGGHE